MPQAAANPTRRPGLRKVAATVLLVAVAVSGCMAGPDADQDPAPSSPIGDEVTVGGGPTPVDPPAPRAANVTYVPCSDATTSCTLRGQGDGCWDVAVVFYQDLALINAYLPDGFLAEPALDTYARAGLSGSGLTYPGPIGDLDANQGTVALFMHKCTSASDGMGAMEEAWVWMFIQPPLHDQTLARASLDIYEWGHAGGSNETMHRKAALGWHVFGDAVETDSLDSSSSSMQLDGRGQVFASDASVASVAVRGAYDSSIVGTGILRVWHASDTGIARIDFDLGGAGTRNYLSSDFDCDISGTPIAEITGYSTCDEAAADTSHPPPTGLINPSHGHPMVFSYTARSDE